MARGLPTRFWLNLCTHFRCMKWMKTHQNVKSQKNRMLPHTQSPPTVKRGTAAALVSLLAAGAAGVSIGGPRWGFLGAALLLFCVGWVCHLFQYDHRTEEIERDYDPPPTA